MTDAGGTSRHRRLALGGVIGPATFVAAWAMGAVVQDRGLSPIDDAISQLAHVDTNTRWLMTAGLGVFAIGVGAFAASVRWTLGAATMFWLGATAASTVAVAALPLGVSDTVDRLHGVAAGLGYLTLVAAPLAARRPLARLGATRVSRAGTAAAAVAAASLVASLTIGPTGLFQRIGLTVVDVWIVVVAALLATGRLQLRRQGRQPPEVRDGDRSRPTATAACSV